ncbi:MAG: effector-binding domain-containing protein [Verrucomicrobiales bacterium]|jgi:effector-binding domain-containing protein
MRWKLPLLISGVFVLAGSSLALAADLFNRNKYESPNYEVVRTDGKFEIRNYSEMVVVSAKMEDGKSERNSAFRQLFKYISGENEKQEKIAMTSPVFTTPAKGNQEGKGGVMSFVVPADVAKAGAPKADSDSVKVSKRAAGKFAVYRYSGRWTESRENSAKKTLKEWMEKDGLKATGQVEKANYDPPFTPPFLRRNEVLVRIGS